MIRTAILLCVAAALGPVLLVAAAEPATPDAPEAPPGVPIVDPDPVALHPATELFGVDVRVYRAGELTQDVQAEHGRLDEQEKLVDIDAIRMRFYHHGALRGTAACGSARLWLSSRPGERIGAQDVMFKQDVTVRTPEGWVLTTDRMRYYHRHELIKSNTGYVKQIALRDGYLVGRGRGFEIRLAAEGGSFQSWYEYGDPATLETSAQAVLEP